MAPSTHLPDEEHVDSLTGAYALDALDDVERVRVERHLAGCQACAAEVASFAETAARLATGAAAAPPSGLRDRVLTEAARTRQLPPRTESSARARAARPSPAVRWLGAAAAALVAVSAGLGVLAWDRAQEAEQARLAAQQMSEVLVDPRRQVVDTDFADGRGTVVMSGDRVVLLGDGVPDPPEGHGYQLWLIGADGPRPSVMLEQSGHDDYRAQASGMRTGDGVGVTVEPSGGSREPTTDPVLLVPPARG